MKRIILSVGLFLGCAVAILCVQSVYAQATGQEPWLDYAGLHIGAKSTDKIGFYGKAPVAQQGIGITLTNGAALAECVTKLQSIHTALINNGLCKTNAP